MMDVMTRAPRLDPIDGWHHVMNRGVNGAHIFTSDDDRRTFGRLLGEVSDRYGIEIHAYCLMGTHFHLLLRCPAGGLSAAMHHLQSSFARIVNDRTGRTGHLFGAWFSSRLITEVHYLANVVRYIHQNPMDIPGVADIATYRWSSHRTYLGFRRPPPWLHLDIVLGWFDHDSDAFDRFVRAADSPDDQSHGPSPDDLLCAVDLLLTERSLATVRHFPAQRRAAVLALLPTMRVEDRDGIVRRLGITSPGALRTALSRGRALSRTDPVIDDVVGHAQRLFTTAHGDEMRRSA